MVEPVVATIDVAPTIMQAMGLKTPPHMDGTSFLPLAEGQAIPWRDYFLYVYYWEQNYPQTPTHFSLRGDRFKYTTYYGLWDTDELFDLQADPQEQNNLIHDPGYAETKVEMQTRLYAMMDELGGMTIPLNPPRGRQQNKRLRSRGGVEAADFPEAMIVDQPLRKSCEKRNRPSGRMPPAGPPNATEVELGDDVKMVAVRLARAVFIFQGGWFLDSTDGLCGVA